MTAPTARPQRKLAPGARSDGEPAAASPFTPPAITLPKGGGAIRGIGEKFAANAATGTGTLTIPLPASPGRSGFGPSLSLAYDSGAAHGPFGMGWSVGLPSITRKTDRGLPKYDDAAESDVFILSGAEDLVPMLDAAGEIERRPRTIGAVDYEVVRYRPRVEGLFARIERWTQVRGGQIHWRSISRDNVTTLYGTSDESRIADPADPARRVFSWLIAESFDDKGNTLVYRYARENSDGVDLASAHEAHRDDDSRSANRYLKSIRYGNRVSPLVRPARPDEWLFELVFDYGDHDPASALAKPSRPWLCRNDPFSSYRSGFEIRTYRLCQRILMFHHFPDEPGVGVDCLVRSMALRYRSTRGLETDRQRGDPAGAFLESVTVTGHRRAPSGMGYISRSLPPLELGYSVGRIATEVNELDDADLENLPEGLSAAYQWVDLDGESISGVLTEQAGAWYYKPNLGDGRFGPLQQLPLRPSLSLAGGRSQLLDLAGDGTLDVVSFGGPTRGFFERLDGDDWSPQRSFRSLPALDWQDENLRFADMDGDGYADVVQTAADAVVWYPSLGKDGFGEAIRVAASDDENCGPRLVFADGTQSVYFADLSGDGLSDLVRIRNGEVCYWPNLGYGRFGAPVRMDRSPHFDRPDQFEQRRIRLADLDGSGPTDIVYLGADGVDLYYNQMGNGWSKPVRPPAFPQLDDISSVSVVDLLGHGTACLVWSSPLPGATRRPLLYLDLFGEKPHLLTQVRNNLGAETRVTYASSTKFYLADKSAGRPWITQLPFPVHVVETVVFHDHVVRNRFITTYRYRHGRYDAVDRQFAGFGMVEQRDVEHVAALSSDADQHPPPVVIMTWFHTGAAIDRNLVSTGFAREYYSGAPAADSWRLDDSPLPPGLATADEREACRALRGRMLRQEVYAEDLSERSPHPYTVVERNYSSEILQSAAGARHAVVAVHPLDTVTANCERDPTDARVIHELVLAVDPFGTVTHSVTIAYGRDAQAALPARTAAVQNTTLVTESRVEQTNAVEADDVHRAPASYDTQMYQIAGPKIDSARPVLARSRVVEIIGGASVSRTLVERERTRMIADDLSGPLPWGLQGHGGMPYETYRLALTAEMVNATFGSRVTATDLRSAGYRELDGAWWAPSGTVDRDAQHFFLPQRFADPFGAATTVEHDRYDLLIAEVVDAVGNRITAGERDAADMRTALRLDYRVLSPTLTTDANRNRTAIACDALGQVVATALMGKPEDDTRDRVDDVTADLTPAVVATLWAEPDGAAPSLLGRATTRLVYDVDAFLRTREGATPTPVGIATITRERHVADSAPSSAQVSFSYSDGTGQEVQKKLPAEPPAGSAVPRWVGTGWVVRDAKSRPVREYEPFFTTQHGFEFSVTAGTSSISLYDPLGRVTARVHAEHTYEKVRFGAWEQVTWDANDTAAWQHIPGGRRGDPSQDPDVAGLLTALATVEYLPTWDEQRRSGALGPAEAETAQKTELHADTPTRVYLDALGRAVLTAVVNVILESAAPVRREHRTHTVLDIRGDQLEVFDCTDGTPGLVSAAHDRLVARYAYDLRGTILVAESMDCGPQRRLVDAQGRDVALWETIDDVSGAERRLGMTYDALRRPLDVVLREGGSQLTVARTQYGENVNGGDMTNLRGRVHKTFDGAGEVTHEYDLAGNRSRISRRFTHEYRSVIDWAANVALENRVWHSTAIYDALNRPRSQTLPDGTVIQPAYNRAGLLASVTAQLAGDTAGTGFLRGAEYNARGQRTVLEHGNGVRATYTYDPATFRLRTLKTVRLSGGREDHPLVQSLTYSYDPVGNVTHVADAAQPLAFTHNSMVSADKNYRYDAAYRLLSAIGREHLSASATTWDDAARVNPADPTQVGVYEERFTYDVAGNLTALAHVSRSPGGSGWTRTFEYDEPNLVQPGTRGNRLAATSTGTATESYAFDVRGNMTSLPPLQLVRWDYRNRLQATSRQQVVAGIPSTTYHVYDDTGERARKITDAAAASATDAHARNERLYFGAFELYREFNAAGAVTSVRATIHIGDDVGRVALVERNLGPTQPPTRLVRYQYGDHLGSATVELDEAAELISYEDFYAYGGTALQVFRAGTPPKRYRHIAKERDPESGLVYHGARFYAPWLARWTAADPDGIADGPNLYLYCRGNPVTFHDRTGRQSQVAADILRRHKQNASKYEAMNAALSAARAAQRRGDTAGETKYRAAALSDLHQKIREGQEFGTKALAGVTALMGAPIAIGYGAGVGVPAVTAFAATKPTATFIATSVTVGIIDPNPMGSVDIPGPFDDAARAGKAGFKQIVAQTQKAASTQSKSASAEFTLLRDLTKFLAEEGISDPVVRREIIEAGLQQRITATATLERFRKIIAREFSMGRDLSELGGKLGNLETRVKVLNQALEIENAGLKPAFEVSVLGGKYDLDLVALKDGKLVEAWSLVKSTSLTGPPVINPREAGLAAWLQNTLGIPVHEIITGIQRPLQ